MHLMIYFQLNDLEIGKGYNLNSEKVETWHGIIIYPHNMCEKLRGLRQKLDALRVQTGLSLSKYKGFTRKLMCYKDISFSLSLFQLKTFYKFHMHHSKPHTENSTLSDFICYFSYI